MIHKIHTARPTFKAVLQYACDKKCAEILGGNTAGFYTGELIKEFSQYEKLNSRVKTPCFHASLSLAEGEHLDANQWQDAAEGYLKTMGIDPEKCPFIFVKHNDSNCEHIHIIASRVDGQGRGHFLRSNEKYVDQKDGKTKTKNANLGKIGMAFCRDFEREHGLKKPEPQKKRGISRPEKEHAKRLGQSTTAKEKIQNAIDSIIEKNTFDLKTDQGRAFFKNALDQHGIGVTFQKAGASFHCDGRNYSGTKLGTEYKFKRLTARALHQEPQQQTQKTPAPPAQARAARQSSGISEGKIFLQTMAQEWQREQPDFLRALLIYYKRIKALEKAKAEAEKLREAQSQGELSTALLSSLNMFLAYAEMAEKREFKNTKEVDDFWAKNYSPIQYTPSAQALQRAAGAAQGSAESLKTESHPVAVFDSLVSNKENETTPTTTPAPPEKAAAQGVENLPKSTVDEPKFRVTLSFGDEPAEPTPAQAQAPGADVEKEPEPPAKPALDLDAIKGAYIAAKECGNNTKAEKILKPLNDKIKNAKEKGDSEQEKNLNETKKAIEKAGESAFENMLNKKAENGKPLIVAYIKPRENERGFLEMQGATLIWQEPQDATGDQEKDQRNQENQFVDLIKNLEKIAENNPDSPMIFIGDGGENLRKTNKGIASLEDRALSKNAILRKNSADFAENPAKIWEKASLILKSYKATQQASAKVAAEIAAKKAAAEKAKKEQEMKMQEVAAQSQSKGVKRRI